MVLFRAMGASLTLLIAMPLSAFVPRQSVDRTTLANGKKLHFHIIEGRRDDIILFESGGGDEATVWSDLLAPVADATGATLITYDRPGFGSSEIDPEHHGLTSDIERLESGLHQLGYEGHVTLVSHSLGGFYSTLFAARHPQQVRAAVLLDINLACFFTDAFLPSMRNSETELQSFKASNPGRYYLAQDFEPMALQMRSVNFPKTIPVIDLVAEHRTFPKPEDGERWRNCHAAFAAQAPQRTELIAFGAGHYIFKSNPELAVAAILEAHALANGTARPELTYVVTALNEQKRKDEQYARSEDALNEWGYDLMHAGRKQEAVKTFELNAALHPNSSNALDSLGEGYEALEDREAAVRSYRQAVQLNPNAKHAAERLKSLINP